MEAQRVQQQQELYAHMEAQRLQLQQQHQAEMDQLKKEYASQQESLLTTLRTEFADSQRSILAHVQDMRTTIHYHQQAIQGLLHKSFPYSYSLYKGF
jgi:hypothetical protein